MIQAGDDYGTGYYFRENVKNNYLNFAGMCWRIVRIEGDQSIKLILEDKYAVCNDDAFTGNWDDEDKIGSAYKPSEMSAFLFSDLSNFQTLLSNKIYNGKKISDFLKNDEWCFRNDLASEADEYGFFIYGSAKRLLTDKEPSLECSGTKLTKYADNTSIYVGTLTADEIAFAGGTALSNNTNYYLINGYAQSNNLDFLTLSYFSSSSERVQTFNLTSNGKISQYSEDEPNYVLRAAVTLLRTTPFIGGNGSIESPYVVE